MSLTPKERQELFLELARTSDGTTAQDAYKAGVARGDTVSEEAYFNLGRRLAHSGRLRAEKSGGRTVYSAKIDDNATWLDEEHIASIIDPEFPLSALTAYRESLRQIRDIPEAVWIEARERLSSVDAQELFVEAIASYADNLLCEVKDYARERAGPSSAAHLPNMRRSADACHATLVSLCKDGLGLSEEALALPINIDMAAEAVARGRAPERYYNLDILRDEISRRVEPGMLIRPVDMLAPDNSLLIAGIDGSSVGGLLSLDGAGGDFAFGHSPQVSINTAAGILNRDIQTSSRHIPAYMRLPEKPEDMQQKDNRYSIMAKMFYPDLTDSEYMHSTWNAMDLLECRATLNMMGRWTMLPNNLEIPAAEIVLRDGTIVPHDRDPAHYGQQNSYGRIVRDLIDVSWKIAKNCQVDRQTVLGVVKNAQMRVFGPVVNYFLGQVASKSEATQLSAWSLAEMNQLFDQALLSRILTAGRSRNEAWLRTALVLRPFHATSNLSRNYSRSPGNQPHDKLLQKAERARGKDMLDITEEDVWWRTLRPNSDPYIQMLRNVWYAGFYLGAFQRLDSSESLSRMEFIVPHSTDESGAFPSAVCDEQMARTVTALNTVGFQVDDDHSMFNKGHIDLLPSILVRSHELVKRFASELRDRVSEFMDWNLAKYLSSAQMRRLKVRPWTRGELKAWVDAMQEERRLKGPQ
jgi:hypothetical protein